MSANPSLVRTFTNELIPAPFPGEHFLARREGMWLELDNVATQNGRWTSRRGRLFLSNIRLVYLADQADAGSGLACFDFPLVYINRDSLNQPIFGSNNISGEVWPAVPGGGPAGTLPPHEFTIFFMEGGIGTFYPMFFTLVDRAKRSFGSPTGPGRRDPIPASFASSLASSAFIDPNDPTTVYLSQPAGEEQRLPERPIYAANYGQDDDALAEDMIEGHGRRS